MRWKSTYGKILLSTSSVTRLISPAWMALSFLAVSITSWLMRLTNTSGASTAGAAWAAVAKAMVAIASSCFINFMVLPFMVLLCTGWR
ncbi:hypothetical protein D3C72_2147730 [compost metagenome]